MTRLLSLTLLGALTCLAPALAQDVRVRLRDGTVLEGELLDFKSARYRVKTDTGVRELRANQVASLDFVENTLAKGAWRATFDLASTPKLAAGLAPGPFAFLDLEGRRFGRLPNWETWTKAQRTAYREASGGDVASWADLVVQLEDLTLYGTPRKRHPNEPFKARLANAGGALPAWTSTIAGLTPGLRLRARSRSGRHYALLVRRAEAGKLVLDVSPAKPPRELAPPRSGAWRAVLNGTAQARTVGLLDLQSQSTTALGPKETAPAGEGPSLLVVVNGGRVHLAHPEWLSDRIEPTRSLHACGELSAGAPLVVALPSYERYRVHLVHLEGNSVALDLEPLGPPPFAEIRRRDGSRTVLHSGIGFYEDQLLHVILRTDSFPGTWLERYLCKATEVQGLLDMFPVNQEGKVEALIKPYRIEGADHALVRAWLTVDALGPALNGQPIPYTKPSGLDGEGFNALSQRAAGKGWSGAVISPVAAETPHKPRRVSAPWAFCESGSATLTHLEQPLAAAPHLGPFNAPYGSDELVWIELDYAFPNGDRLVGRLPLQVFQRDARRQPQVMSAWLLSDAKPLTADERTSLWPLREGTQWCFEQEGNPGFVVWDLGSDGKLTLTVGGRSVTQVLERTPQGDLVLESSSGRLNLGQLVFGQDTTTVQNLPDGLQGTVKQTSLNEPLDVLGRRYPQHVVLDLAGDNDGKRDGARYRLAPGLGLTYMRVSRGKANMLLTIRLARSTLLGDPLFTPPQRAHALPGYRIERDEPQAGQKLPDPAIYVNLDPEQARLKVIVRNPQTDAPLEATIQIGQNVEECKLGAAVLYLESLESLKEPFTLVVTPKGYRAHTLELVPDP